MTENNKNDSQKKTDNTYVFSSSSEYNSCDTPEQTRARQYYEPQSKPGFFKIFFKESPTNIILAGATCVLTIATIFLACYTFGLVSDAQEQTKKIQRQVEISDSSLKLSERIANENTSNIRKNDSLNEIRFQTEMRAYVFMDGVHGAIIKKGRLHFEVAVTNYGKTPASKKSFVDCIFTDSTNFYKKVLLRIPFKVDSGMKMEKYFIPIAPSKTAQLTNSTSDFSTTQKWYVWGTVEYLDFFGKPHHTHFCGEAEYVGNSGTFAPIGNYNDAN